MLSTDRSEFEAHLGAMFGAWNRVLSSNTIEGYWKGCALMELSQFIRCCSKAIQSYTEDSTQRLPDVGALWAMKRSLRAIPPVNHEPDSHWTGDRWDQAANRHLLAYVVANGSRHYNAEETGVLVEWKKGWAGDMRESAADGTLPADHGRQWWTVNMQRAEEQINALRGSECAASATATKPIVPGATVTASETMGSTAFNVVTGSRYSDGLCELI